MRILIVNGNFEGGGIRQALFNLLENLKYQDLDIDVQLFDPTKIDELNLLFMTTNINFCSKKYLLYLQGTPFKEIAKTKKFLDMLACVITRVLQKIIGRRNLFVLLLKFCKETQYYDVGISFSNDIWQNGLPHHYIGCNDYILRNAKTRRKIAWIHNDPYRLGFTKNICEQVYGGFNAIVNVSYACKEMFDEIIPEFRDKSKVVYNMIDVAKVTGHMAEASPYNPNLFNIVTVARVDNQQKRIDRVLDCCIRLKENGCDKFIWTIVGDGPDLTHLEEYAKRNNILDCIDFVGRKLNPYPYIKHADVFVLTSDYEAYPMVLIEALSNGTPIICTDYPGAQEVVIDGKNGITTELSVDSIYSSLQLVMNNPSILNDMRKYISDNPVSNERCLEQFMDVIRGD